VVRRGKSKANPAAPEVALKLQTTSLAPGVDLSQQEKTLKLVKGKKFLSNMLETITFNGGVCTVVELHTGKELLRELGATNAVWRESDAVKVIARLLEAVQALRAVKVLHLNITSENILFEEKSGQLVLEGFTLSRVVQSEQEIINSPIAGGTLQFQAPEVIFSTGYSFAADMWSVGVVAYILLTGQVPFTETHPVKLKVAIKKGVASFPATLSKDATAFLQALLSVDSAKRPTPQAALEHPLIKGGGSATPVANFRQLMLRQGQK